MRDTARRQTGGDLVTVLHVEEWRASILTASNVVQDGDDSVPDDVAERRFLEFIDLVDAVDGTEGEAVYRTLLECLRPQQDYGAYQTLLGALWRWPSSERGQLTARHLPRLVEINPEMAGDVLANVGSDAAAAHAFNAAATALPSADLGLLRSFIEQEEVDGGWLDRDDLRGRLGPNRN